MEAFETIDYKGYKIELHQDTAPQDPREWDNLSKIICFHKRYQLGDKTELKSDMFNGWDELEEHLIKKEHSKIIYPIYMYDHSGIGLSLDNSNYPFNCRWDSGQVGFIYITKETIIKEYGKLNKSTKERAKKVLLAEFSDYDNYVRDAVYGYIILNPEGENIESCWGFFGDNYNKTIPECEAIVDNDIKQRQEKNTKKLKSFIKNKVPLEKRKLEPTRKV